MAKTTRRKPGYLDLRRRLGDERMSWSAITTVGMDDRLGSEVGRLELRGSLDDRQTEAARLFALACSRSDQVQGMARRNARAARWERGLGDQRDEEAMAARDGSLDDHDRRQRSGRKRWDDLCRALDPVVLGLLTMVCVQDRPCPPGRRGELAAGLDVVARVLRLDGGQVRRAGSIRSWRG